jgi:type IV pilus assembly protein PilN
MIRINLLPSEDKKTKRKISLPSISGGAVLWTVVILIVYVGVVFSISALQMRTLKGYEEKIKDAKEESARLAPQLAKIRKLTKEREEVNRRLGIIASLDRDRYLRVQMMGDISTQLPSNCWLTKVIEQGGTQVTIEGITFSNYIIADFMNNIDKSERLEDTALKIAEEGDIDDHTVIKFTLNSRLVQ